MCARRTVMQARHSIRPQLEVIGTGALGSHAAVPFGRQQAQMRTASVIVGAGVGIWQLAKRMDHLDVERMESGVK